MTEKERKTERETETERDRDSDRETQRDRDTERERESLWVNQHETEDAQQCEGNICVCHV